MTNEPFTIDSHFEGKNPTVRAIYDRLIAEAGQFGPITEEAKKTSIHLVHKTAFAGVTTRKTALLLNVKSSVPILSPRFPKSEKISSNRYHQEVKLTDPAEVDAELLNWLRQAYEISA